MNCFQGLILKVINHDKELNSDYVTICSKIYFSILKKSATFMLQFIFCADFLGIKKPGKLHTLVWSKNPQGFVINRFNKKLSWRFK